MRYKEYFGRQLKAYGYALLGSISLFLSLLLGEYWWIGGIISLGLLGYGGYLIRELRFEREESGNRVYHQRGNY